MNRLTKLIVIAALVIAAAYARMLFEFYQQLWSQPQTQFFPFVIAAFVGLLWFRWNEGEERPNAGRIPALAGACFGLALLTLAAGAYFFNPWISAVSFNILMAGVVLIIAQHRKITYLWGIYALLWLVIPLPRGYDQQLIFRLQLLSSKLSSAFLDVFGVQHVLEGNRMTLINGSRQLFVDEACSGITSVMSIIACAVIYGVWRNRTPFHLLLLTGAGIFWATMMNVLRISTIAVMLDWYDIDWTKGTSHEMLGLAIFVLSFGALLATDLWLEALLEPVLEEYAARTGDLPNYGRRFSRWWDYLTNWRNPLLSEGEPQDDVENQAGVQNIERPAGAESWGLIAAFGALAIMQFALMGFSVLNPTTAVAKVTNAKQLTKDSLPARIGGLKCANFEASKRESDDIYGEFSRSYVFEDGGGAKYQVSCDFPFTGGWHELTICYRGAGWTITERASVTDEAPNDPSWTYVNAAMTNRDGLHGYVAWTMFDDAGETFTPPSDHWQDELWRLLKRRSPYLPTRQLFQVQVFVVGSEPISDTRREQARQLLKDARDRLRKEILKPTAGSTALAPTKSSEIMQGES
jgi:exosortase